MAVDARTEEFQHLELFDKFALFTNARIDRTTVPKGWYCYDFRGTGDDPGELRFIEESVVVNHSGSILMPEKLELPASGQLDAWDEFGFLDECDMTLREFCAVHDLPYPAEEEEFHIRPARPDEAGLFYAQHPSRISYADSRRWSANAYRASPTAGQISPARRTPRGTRHSATVLPFRAWTI